MRKYYFLIITANLLLRTQGRSISLKLIKIPKTGACQCNNYMHQRDIVDIGEVVDINEPTGQCLKRTMGPIDCGFAHMFSGWYVAILQKISIMHFCTFIGAMWTILTLAVTPHFKRDLLTTGHVRRVLVNLFRSHTESNINK